MRKLAGVPLFCVTCFFSAALVARGQSVPAQTGSPLYTGFQMPTVNGTLNWAVNAGVREVFGYTQQISNVTYGTVSANVGFISPSVRMPTTISYTGGYLATTGTYPSAFFHDFSISQVYDTRKFRFTATDQLRYLPDTPANGIYGIVGTGTTVGTTGTQGALIPFATRISNMADGNASFMITGKTSVDATALYDIQRFPGYTGGIQTNTLGFDGGVLHRINPLESWGVRGTYSTFSYVYVTGTFQTEGGVLMYKRQINRRLLIDLAAGPQYIGASTLTKRPSTLSYNADVSASYVGSLEHALTFTAAYKRATTGGAGLIAGVALAIKTLRPDVKIIAAEPESVSRVRETHCSSV